MGKKGSDKIGLVKRFASEFKEFAVKGNVIDLFEWISPAAANRFGKQPRRVWILP